MISYQNFSQKKKVYSNLWNPKRLFIIYVLLLFIVIIKQNIFMLNDKNRFNFPKMKKILLQLEQLVYEHFFVPPIYS